ncbi:Hsp20/alpha crystallin family protein [bacterium]|nr:Hsp20/alpha crystallin family protein [bacterium]
MTLTRYRPINALSAFDAFEQEVARAFGQANNQAWQPQADVEETDNHFAIRVDIPGVDPANVTVNLDDGVLSIAGEREAVTESESKGFRRLERSYGKFERRFRLPEAADEEAVEADANHGVLTVKINKKAAKQPRQIAVKH